MSRNSALAMGVLGLLFLGFSALAHGADVRNIPAVPRDPAMPPYVYQGPERLGVCFTGDYIGQCGDIRGLLGTSGRNVVLSNCGDNLQVVWGRPSGDPNNIMELWYGKSTNGGTTWDSLGPISRYDSRRLYPGIAADYDFTPYLGWQESYMAGGVYTKSPLLFTRFDYYGAPSWWPPRVLEPDTTTYQLWMPSMGVSPWDMGDGSRDGHIVLESAGDMNHTGATMKGFLYRSTDGGTSWGNRIGMVNTDLTVADSIDSPVLCTGTEGYVAAPFDWHLIRGAWAPYFTESSDWGQTWTTPVALPFPAGMGSWWYDYSGVVVDNKPYLVWRFGDPGTEYGAVYFYRRTGTVWDSLRLAPTPPEVPPFSYAFAPTIGADKEGNLHVIYSYIDSLTSTYAIGYRGSSDGGVTWTPERNIASGFTDRPVPEIAQFVSDKVHLVYIQSVASGPTSLCHLSFDNPLMTKTLDVFQDPDHTVVAAGGRVTISVTVHNKTSSVQRFDYWEDVYLPDHQPYPGNPIFLRHVPVAAGQCVSRGLPTAVPRTTPPGVYTLCSRVGTWPSTVIDEDCFNVTITGASEDKDARGARTAPFVMSGELPGEE